MHICTKYTHTHTDRTNPHKMLLIFLVFPFHQKSYRCCVKFCPRSWDTATTSYRVPLLPSPPLGVVAYCTLHPMTLPCLAPANTAYCHSPTDTSGLRCGRNPSVSLPPTYTHYIYPFVLASILMISRLFLANSRPSTLHFSPRGHPGMLIFFL